MGESATRRERTGSVSSADGQKSEEEKGGVGGVHEAAVGTPVARRLAGAIEDENGRVAEKEIRERRMRGEKGLTTGRNIDIAQIG